MTVVPSHGSSYIVTGESGRWLPVHEQIGLLDMNLVPPSGQGSVAAESDFRRAHRLQRLTVTVLPTSACPA